VRHLHLNTKLKLKSSQGIYIITVDIDMSSKEIWIVIIMRLLRNLEMKLSLFTLIMEEGKTLFFTVSEKSFLYSLLLMCCVFSEA